MNDENVEAEVTTSMFAELQAELEGVKAAYSTALKRVEGLEALDLTPPPPVGDDEVRALGATVRTCQRNGHPDFLKHLDALLSTLGV